MKSFLTHSLVAVILLVGLGSTAVQAHCDTMDGPTVADGQAALSQADITPALKWISPENESELTAVFNHVLAARGASAESKELAEKYFLETLVRLHRAGEGAPYTGLKPAGTKIEPPVRMADESLDEGKIDALIAEVTAEVSEGIRARFAKARSAQEHKDHNVDAGRQFVAAYVEYVHYVEKVAETAAMKSVHGEAAAGHQHE